MVEVEKILEKWTEYPPLVRLLTRAVQHLHMKIPHGVIVTLFECPDASCVEVKTSRSELTVKYEDDVIRATLIIKKLLGEVKYQRASLKAPKDVFNHLRGFLRFTIEECVKGRCDFDIPDTLLEKMLSEDESNDCEATKRG